MCGSIGHGWRGTRARYDARARAGSLRARAVSFQIRPFGGAWLQRRVDRGGGGRRGSRCSGGRGSGRRSGDGRSRIGSSGIGGIGGGGGSGSYSGSSSAATAALWSQPSQPLREHGHVQAHATPEFHSDHVAPLGFVKTRDRRLASVALRRFDETCEQAHRARWHPLRGRWHARRWPRRVSRRRASRCSVSRRWRRGGRTRAIAESSAESSALEAQAMLACVRVRLLLDAQGASLLTAESLLRLGVALPRQGVHAAGACKQPV